MLPIFGVTVIGCDNGDGNGDGELDGTSWKQNTNNRPWAFTFSGSNYSLNGFDEDEGVISSGTYTLSINGRDLMFIETSQGTAIYNGHYHPDDEPPTVTIDYKDVGNVSFIKVQQDKIVSV